MKEYLLSIALITTILCLSSPLFASQTKTVMVLSGDIGGTNARLRLSQLKNGEKSVLANETYKVAEHDNVVEVIRLFLSKSNCDVTIIKSMCFAVAGPIKNNTVKLTNSKWFIDAEQLKADLKTPNIKLINDFEAIGYGIETLTDKDLFLLQKGVPEKDSVRAFLGAGTGLGVGFATFDGSQYVVHPTEGGHTSFAPTDDIQIDILKYMHKKYNIDISTERLLSGPGIEDMYHYFRDVNPLNYKENEQLKKSLASNDKEAGKQITDFALEHPDDPISIKTLETFANIYGAKSGDLAFTLLPRGGLYVIGSIATKILTKSPFNKNFMLAFGNKDKVSYVLKDIPVWVVLNTEVGLQGAENYAFKSTSAPINTVYSCNE